MLCKQILQYFFDFKFFIIKLFLLMYKVLVKRRDIMTNDSNRLLSFFDSSFTFFNLKLQASKIKNGYHLKDSLHSLLDFIDSPHLRPTNP